MCKTVKIGILTLTQSGVIVAIVLAENFRLDDSSISHPENRTRESYAYIIRCFKKITLEEVNARVNLA